MLFPEHGENSGFDVDYAFRCFNIALVSLIHT